MANLYRVVDMARDTFYVQADDPTGADAAYTNWVTDPANNMDHEDRLPIHSVELFASEDAAELGSYPWPNLILEGE
jgi:hypothetical protein